MTKKVTAAISFLALVLLMLGCSGLPSKPAMQIQPAELTEKESKIVSLIQSPTDSSAIYDFTADDEVKSVSIICYELDGNGKWNINNGPNRFPIDNAKGRIAISFGKLGEGMRVAIQDGDSMNAGDSNLNNDMAMEGLSSITSYAAAESIIYEKEIPLAMQIFTSNNEVSTTDIALFKEPKKLLNRGFSNVYVVVAKFSTHELI